MAMDIKRKIAGVVAVLAIAFGAGQYLQGSTAKPKVVAAGLTAAPQNVQPVAAGNDAPLPEPLRPLPTQPEMITIAEPEVIPPEVAEAAMPTPPAPELAMPELAAAPDVAADPCPVTLDLSNGANAMIGITLIAPCHAQERVVIKHAGLAITLQTTVTGVLFADIPALVADAAIAVQFADGSQIDSSLAVPEVTGLRRFGVQYQAQDAFQLHAFENGAAYGGPGDISAANARSPQPGIPVSGGYLTQLGDANAKTPLLAEVYTYPMDRTIRSEVVIEAAVTETACGREILGETLSSEAGVVIISDLTVAMPQCDAVGDYLVLKNLAPDLSIASAE